MSPRRILLLDAAGAALSMTMLGVVLPLVQPWIGLPTKTLFLLAAIAALFFLHSTIRAVTIGADWRPVLSSIAFANIAYCLLTLALLIVHHAVLTGWGAAYFISEAAIVLTLAGWELRQARTSSPPEAYR